MINPYRDEAIDQLQYKHPAQIGFIGGTPMWGWLGNLWLERVRGLSEKYPHAVLPVGFDQLTGYCNEGDGIYRGYRSKQEAYDALQRLRRELE